MGKDKKVFVVFDEFSVFAGEQVLNVINMGRSTGLHAVIATQSLSDLGRAVKDGQDHFIRQILTNCNNLLVHRANAPEDAQLLSELIGTKDSNQYTAQTSVEGTTGMGTIKKTRAFIYHPDTIKNLKQGEAIFVNKNKLETQKINTQYGMVFR